MELTEYLQDVDRRNSLALALKTSTDYLRMIAHEHRRAGPAMAMAIEQHTGGEVSKSTLRPDLWPIEPKSRRRA